MPSIQDRLHKTYARGKHLAVVLRWARKYPCEVIRVDCEKNATQHRDYIVTFYFNCEGNIPYYCQTYWADWRALLDWLLNRRSWDSLHRVTFGHDATFELAHADPRTVKLRKKGVSVVGRSQFAKENYPNKA